MGRNNGDFSGGLASSTELKTSYPNNPASGVDALVLGHKTASGKVATSSTPRENSVGGYGRTSD